MRQFDYVGLYICDLAQYNVLTDSLTCVLQKHLSVAVVEVPTAQVVFLQHYLESNSGTAEDCGDIIDTGHLPCVWYAIQIVTSKCDRLTENQTFHA